MREQKSAIQKKSSNPSIKLSAISAILLSCTNAGAYLPKHDFDRYMKPAPPESSPKRVPNPRKALFSTWKGGSCRYQDNTLSYSDLSGKSARIILDYKPDRPISLVCSDEFSVIITNDKAVVALGALSVLEGQNMLGYLGKTHGFVPANSYSVSIRDPKSEGIVTVRISGSKLFLKTARQNTWSTDLSDADTPWDIY